MLGRKAIRVRWPNCSYYNIAKCFRLLDKMAILFIHENFHTSKIFRKEPPLNERIEIQYIFDDFCYVYILLFLPIV